jgi:hypothetical protein
MRYFVRWWETLGRAERIVALSIGMSAPVAIINSTVWAIASAYMVHERSRVEIERLRTQAAQPPASAPLEPGTLGEAAARASWPSATA